MNLLQRLVRQRAPGPSAEAKTRIAMDLGGAMALANVELSRPDIGVEMAELCGAAARAAVIAYTEIANTDSSMFMDFPNISQLAYGKEWQRLQTRERDKWR